MQLLKILDILVIMTIIRTSRPEVFCKKGVLWNFVKFLGKHQYQSLFFNKVAALRLGTLLKKRLWHRCFPVNFAKFLRTPFLQNTYGGCFWIILVVVIITIIVLKKYFTNMRKVHFIDMSGTGKVCIKHNILNLQKSDRAINPFSQCSLMIPLKT